MTIPDQEARGLLRLLDGIDVRLKNLVDPIAEISTLSADVEQLREEVVRVRKCVDLIRLLALGWTVVLIAWAIFAR